jgi:hypothetical protein
MPIIPVLGRLRQEVVIVRPVWVMYLDATSK